MQPTTSKRLAAPSTDGAWRAEVEPLPWGTDEAGTGGAAIPRAALRPLAKVLDKTLAMQTPKQRQG